MIDIHSHILPGIDDGSESLRQSLKMLQKAVADGIKTQVFTPHVMRGRYENSLTDIQSVFDSFKGVVECSGIDIQLRVAAEVRISETIPDMLDAGEIPFIGRWDGYSVFLLELPFNDPPHGAINLIQWLDERGVKVIIAHPERYRVFQQNPKKLEEYIEAGCLTQLTGSSITGLFGKKVYDTAKYFLKKGQIDFVASDCHNLRTRPPGLTEYLSYIKPLVGKQRALDMVETNPAKLLESDPQEAKVAPSCSAAIS